MDVFVSYTITGLFFGASTVLAYDFPPAAYSNLLYTCFMCMVRANVVPSSARRTFVTSVIEFVPMLGVAEELTNDTSPEIDALPVMLSGVFVLVVAESTLPMASLPVVPWMVTLPFMLIALLEATP